MGVSLEQRNRSIKVSTGATCFPYILSTYNVASHTLYGDVLDLFGGVSSSVARRVAGRFEVDEDGEDVDEDVDEGTGRDVGTGCEVAAVDAMGVDLCVFAKVPNEQAVIR